jgi:hypothetical protein
MPVTVKVNGTMNSLVHKGSNGISTATMPDVCKTPSPGGPVPVPYPNVSQSATLAKGTSTVKADGGMMIAIKGSEFSLSNGDNAGVAGGVKSSTFMKESTWILYSFDVKFEGKGACRLTDKKFQNHENTVDMGGTIQDPKDVAELETMLCEIWKECEDSVNKKHNSGSATAAECWDRTGGKEPLAFTISKEKHACCKQSLQDKKDAAKKAKSKRKVLPKVAMEKAKKLPGGGKVRLDVVVGKPLNKVYDFKFQCPKRVTPPKWPIYRWAPKGKSIPKGFRRTTNKAFDRKPQSDLIKAATGKDPAMINENTEPCKAS